MVELNAMGYPKPPQVTANLLENPFLIPSAD